MSDMINVKYNGTDYELDLDQRVWVIVRDRIYYRMFMPGLDSLIDIHDDWEFNGNVFTPTFSPSVLTKGGRGSQPHSPSINHVFIRNGIIDFLADCTHALAGTTGELPRLRDWPEWCRFWEESE